MSNNYFLDQQILDLLLANFPQVVWWKDVNSVFLGCNDNCIKASGLQDKSQLIGKTDYDLWSAEDADAIVKKDKEIMLTGKPQLNFEEVLTLQNGEKKWLSTSKVPLYDESKKIIGTIGWFHDITEYKQAKIDLDDKTKALITYNSQIQKANKVLKLSNIDLETFTYAASHDLKGPLITISSFAKLLKQNEANNVSDTSRRMLDMIIDSTNRMETLVNDLLDYAQSGLSGSELAIVDLNSVVTLKLKDLAQIIESRSVKVNLNLPLDKIKCHPTLIGMIYYNLISNSIKYNQSQSPVIDCDFTEHDDYWEFSVKDNGIGIDSKYADQIFEPFKRLVNRKINGSGLGLTICKRVVVLHDGDIWIKPVDGRPGTQVLFTISKNL